MDSEDILAFGVRGQVYAALRLLTVPLKGIIMTITNRASMNFYEEFLMARRAFTPQEFGVDMGRNEFDDLMDDDFGAAYKGHWTIDELLLHPREAALFCDDTRRKHRFFDVPDDIILRVILQRRKNP